MKKFELETTIDGKTHKGYRVIKSNKDGKFQVIHLDDNIFERDGEIYTDSSSEIALFAARDILRKLVLRCQFKFNTL